tara:strand:+ start:1152 stop:1346 length:195 start_codon:yes stop_codon:yes gene_type:complete
MNDSLCLGFLTSANLEFLSVEVFIGMKPLCSSLSSISFLLHKAGNEIRMISEKDSQLGTDQYYD